MTTRIGLSGAEVTVPDPVVDPDYEESPELLAGVQRALDGTLQACYAGSKLRWRVTWQMLTAAQRTTLVTELTRASNLSWEPPTGGSYTVHVVPSPDVRGTPLGWTVRAELMEV